MAHAEQRQHFLLRFDTFWKLLVATATVATVSAGATAAVTLTRIGDIQAQTVENTGRIDRMEGLVELDICVRARNVEGESALLCFHTPSRDRYLNGLAQ